MALIKRIPPPPPRPVVVEDSTASGVCMFRALVNCRHRAAIVAGRAKRSNTYALGLPVFLPGDSPVTDRAAWRSSATGVKRDWSKPRRRGSENKACKPAPARFHQAVETMSRLVAIVCISGLVLAGGAALEWVRLRRFWSRACTGKQWRQRFPDASKVEIREFLDLLVEAFAFRQKRRLCFAPNDRIMEIYRALYPFPKMMADSMELEDFIMSAQKRYGVDFLPLWREDITLADLFAQTRKNVA